MTEVKLFRQLPTMKGRDFQFQDTTHGNLVPFVLVPTDSTEI
jgi:hypothetical protein